MSTDILILENESDADRVRVARAVKHLRQVDVAVLAGVPVALVSALERGWTINRRRRRAVFAVLGLEAEDA